MKTVLITGSSRGLGSALTEVFSSFDWSVLATARNVSSIAVKRNISPFELDLSNELSVSEFSQKVNSQDKQIDLFINNAGFNPKDSGDRDYFLSTFTLENFSSKNVADSLWINSLMPLQLISNLQNKLSHDAVILNISSWLGSITNKKNPGHYGYGGSKALLNMFTKAAALEFAETEKSVIALNPGWMKTDMGGSKASEDPSDIANKIYLLYESGKLHKSNGQFLNIDGSIHPW